MPTDNVSLCPWLVVVGVRDSHTREERHDSGSN